eukprot:709317-Rhodomonas_salina.1
MAAETAVSDQRHRRHAIVHTAPALESVEQLRGLCVVRKRLERRVHHLEALLHAARPAPFQLCVSASQHCRSPSR